LAMLFSSFLTPFMIIANLLCGLNVCWARVKPWGGINSPG